MLVTVVMGPPGGGKSTYVEANAKPGDVIVDFDKIAKAFGAVFDHDVSTPIGQVVFAARQAAIARVFDSLDGSKDMLPVDAWIIQWNLDDATLKQWRDLGCEFVVCDPGKEEVLRRLEEEGRPQSSVDAALAWYDNMPDLGAKGETTVKTKAARIALDGELPDGVFEGYASVFGNVDSYGDVVLKGAFAESLATYGPDGSGIPCYWGHRMDDPMMNIGKTLEAVEDDHGLRVKVQLDLESPTGAHVHKLIKQGRVAQMSFAYDILDAAPAEKDGVNVFELRKLHIHEVSVVPIGANQETELLAVKHGVPLTSTDPVVEDDTSEVEEPDEEPAGQVEAKASESIAPKRVAIEAALFISNEKGIQE